MIPTYTLTGDKFEVKGLGTAYTAILNCSCTWDELLNLRGTSIEIDGIVRKIKYIEQYAVFYHSENTPFSIIAE